MYILGINGSPRKKWNTAMLLEKALAGAAEQGAKTELVHLYDLDFKGCISCFACKTLNGKSYGACAVKDSLTPVLRKALDADALILGSPIYFGAETGEMRSFMERLLFPYFVYGNPPGTLYPRKIPTGYIYTMNMPESRYKEIGLDARVVWNTRVMTMVFGSTESLLSFDTLQFDDYSKYAADSFDPEQKARMRREVFPLDEQRAFELGKKLSGGQG